MLLNQWRGWIGDVVADVAVVHFELHIVMDRIRSISAVVADKRARGYSRYWPAKLVLEKVAESGEVTKVVTEERKQWIDVAEQTVEWVRVVRYRMVQVVEMVVAVVGKLAGGLLEVFQWTVEKTEQGVAGLQD